MLWNIVTDICTISVSLSKIVNDWMESTRPTRYDSAAKRTKSAASRGTKVRESIQDDPPGTEPKDIYAIVPMTADARSWMSPLPACREGIKGWV